MFRAILKPFSLVFFSLLFFSNTFLYPFVHDDIVFIQKNPTIGRFDVLPQLFLSSDHSLKKISANVNAYYRPFLEIIYRFEYFLFGLNPFGWHVVNAIWHGINGILVYTLAQLLGMGVLTAWALALVFCVHPIQSEAVVCISGISNIGMAFFVLAALNFYLKDKIFLSLMCFLLGMISKEGAIVFVPLMLLVDWYRQKKNGRIWLLNVFVLCVFIFIRGIITQNHLLQDIMASPGELKLRVMAIAQDLVMYVRVLVLPFDLHYYRSTDILTANPWWWGIVAVVVYVLSKANRLIRFGALWFLICLLPVLNIIPLVNEYSLILTSEHFLYLSMIGICIIVFECARIIFKENKRWLKVGFMIGIALLAMIMVRQNTHWQSEISLFERTLQYEPNFGRVHLLLGKAYYFKKDYKRADHHFIRAYVIMKVYEVKVRNPESKRFYRQFIKEILFCWAHSLEETGHINLAKAKYIEALVIDPKDPALWNNLGVLSLRMKETAQAKQCFTKAIQVDPHRISVK